MKAGNHMIISASKNLQPEEKLIKMTSRAFPYASVDSIIPLEEGYFNAAYKIILNDGTKTVLKIAPSPDILVMTHENGIMESEVLAMKMISEKTSVPTAKILYYDNNHSICDSDYFIMEFLEGTSFDKLSKEADNELREIIDYQAGQYNNEINSLTSKMFGYFGQPDKQKVNWYETFRSIIDDVFNDASAYNIDMGCDRNNILSLLNNHKEYFYEVTIPRFVHWDIWAGNIFVKDKHITGIIDYERCLWADPLMEVGFRGTRQSKAFLAGYGKESLTESECIRIKWYDLYMYMINAMESDYRKYSDKGMYYWAKDNICKIIEELK